jgi:D-alanine-D-alanine ligase
LKRIAVLAGGWSGERPISLISGGGAFEALSRAGFKPLGLDLVSDQPLKMKPLASPAWAKRVRLSALLPSLRQARVDKVLICLHGPGGEDGRIQGLFDLAGISYTGSGALASAMAMHKRVTKEILFFRGLPTPAWKSAWKKGPAVKFTAPCVVKPVEQGSALGVSVVRGPREFKAALKLAWRFDREALIERYIPGRELTVSILGRAVLPVVEILPDKADFYDYASKYDAGGSRHLCPAPISKGLTKRAQLLALQAHLALGCEGATRTDMMMDKKGGLWILEVNTVPGLTPVSLLPDAARAVGLSYVQLLKEMIRLA